MLKVFALMIVLGVSAQAQINRTQTARFNENSIVHALRQVHGAQVTYFATFGAGNYALAIQALVNQNFLDSSFLSSMKFGYRLALHTDPATSQNPSRFYFTATPDLYGRNGRNSFYIDEFGVIRGADLQGAVATIATPAFQSPYTCGERGLVSHLRNVHGSEVTYQATSGAGSYGGFNELIRANLINTELADVFGRGYGCGYRYSLAFTHDTFQMYLTPLSYPDTGIRSYFISEIGVIHAADKHGFPADENDPPIQ